MAERTLRDDALAAVPGGFELRIGLPWIRSMPLSSVGGLSLSVDDTPTAVDIVVGGRRVAPADLADEPGWWFIQDRLVLTGDGELGPSEHGVDVRFTLMVPYLQGAPGAPLTLPFRLAARLTPGTVSGVPTVARDVA